MAGEREVALLVQSGEIGGVVDPPYRLPGGRHERSGEFPAIFDNLALVALAALAGGLR
jgi:hypothetical protein